MLSAFFALLLGFSVTATLGGLISNWSVMDRIVMALMVLVGIGLALVDPVFDTLGPLRLATTLVTHSVLENTVWTLAGASIAVLSIMVGEGVLDGLLRPWQDLLGLTPRKPAVGPLGARDELFAKLCLYTFQDGRRAVLTDLETVLRAGVGHRQQALHAIAAPGVRGHSRIDPVFLIRQYRTHFDEGLTTAPVIYAMLCRMAMITGSNTAMTTKRLHRIGHALQLDRGQMNEALSRA